MGTEGIAYLREVHALLVIIVDFVTLAPLKYDVVVEPSLDNPFPDLCRGLSPKRRGSGGDWVKRCV